MQEDIINSHKIIVGKSEGMGTFGRKILRRILKK
jgi:hypothetical protein